MHSVQGMTTLHVFPYIRELEQIEGMTYVEITIP